MKRRTRRRILRTLLTSVAVGSLVAAACWHRWRQPMDEAAVVAAARRDRQIASCEQMLRPRLQGEVESWRLIGEQPGVHAKQFTFAANYNANTALYHCEVDSSAMVLAVEGPE